MHWELSRMPIFGRQDKTYFMGKLKSPRDPAETEDKVTVPPTRCHFIIPHKIPYSPSPSPPASLLY